MFPNACAFCAKFTFCVFTSEVLSSLTSTNGESTGVRSIAWTMSMHHSCRASVDRTCRRFKFDSSDFCLSRKITEHKT